MKTTFKKQFGVLMLSLLFVSLSCISGYSEDKTKQNYNLDGFTGIELAVPGNLQLTQSNHYSVNIDASARALEIIVVEISGDNLVIRTKRGENLRSRDGKIKIHVTMPTIKHLGVAGSGNINSSNPIRTESLSVRVAGSGNINVPLSEISSLNAKVAGSGDITLLGETMAQDASVSIAGSGNVKAREIVFSEAQAKVTGSGSIYINVADNLTSRVAGSGDIIYSGNPLVDTKISGSGSVRNR